MSTVMTRFASECLKSLSIVTKQLEGSLGSCDLQGRCGLHSGPVTAGILRGEKARFQLFGDTMNTASRMESSGIPGRIHVSVATAALLEEAGKAHWVSPRQEVVFLKGKGNQQTYFAHPKSSGTTTQSGTTHEGDDSNLDAAASAPVMHKRCTTGANEAQIDALVDQTVEILHTTLVTTLASRTMTDSSNVSSAAARRITVPTVAKDQIRCFVLHVSHLHRQVPFHSFYHASNVTKTVADLMTVLTNTNDTVLGDKNETRTTTENDEQVSSIGSGPNVKLAAVFAAVIHHVDHMGLTDEELVLEKEAAAAVYGEKHVAEQNALDIAWKSLVDGPYNDLRACLYSTNEEMEQFYQLVRNAVLATAVYESDCKGSSEADLANRCLVDVMQAAEVFHYYQDFSTFREFNALLFEERYMAWARGVSGAQDPSLTWHEAQISFFDHVVLPLVSRLQENGAFAGTGSDGAELARQNRAEWESKGPEIVGELLEHAKAKYENIEDVNDHRL
jgi:Adenylate and Guanylate cyclase catalytic domain/3'5'-cyclic nucleotide phosphodiesterase